MTSSNQGFEPREIVWTPEYVRRFWSYLGQSAHAERAYFSSHSGDALVELVKKHVPLTPDMRILDFGCGPGFLVERLVSRGLTAEGLEFSDDSRRKTMARCERYPSFKGTTLADSLPSGLPAGTFNCVFLVEVIEHLLPQHIDDTFREIMRLLKPGGFIIVTTPHNEDLEAAKTMCPGCGLVFHPWQHVGSFTVPGLSAMLAGHGATKKYAAATTIGAAPLSGLARFARRLLGRTALAPHLVYIGQKP